MNFFGNKLAHTRLFFIYLLLDRFVPTIIGDARLSSARFLATGSRFFLFHMASLFSRSTMVNPYTASGNHKMKHIFFRTKHKYMFQNKLHQEKTRNSVLQNPTRQAFEN